MADIRPFQGVRPADALAGEVIAPPYDVLSEAEARAIVADNPRSFLKVTRSEVDLAEGRSGWRRWGGAHDRRCAPEASSRDASAEREGFARGQSFIVGGFEGRDGASVVEEIAGRLCDEASGECVHVLGAPEDGDITDSAAALDLDVDLVGSEAFGGV